MKPIVAALLFLLAACKPAPEAAPEASAPALASPAAGSAGTPTATPGAPTRYVWFGNHVPRAEILSIEGVDTASATLTGRTTAQDNYDYCIGYAGPDDTEVLARCAAEKVEQPVETMTADCLARTVSDGSSARWVRDEPGEGGKIAPVWQDVASGEIRDYSGAGGGYVLTAAFRLMCPAASVDIQPDPR
ncbi:hypothetical protein [Brevundimonas subvibrioides]|uniref:Lipoprotein n=1 Tax=Brevundimonas subvibrioides (strain ATCC 15264 / DSM 4735 / LMG 14903 / NBRC 16000 / CB 81) TaxID=633149 RepID=D9QJ74_BRESC|nr:hypothetical protein [Brevundimonas subvibrioides]ADK99598.1 hypothetical protein Bresu_0284 [Brevundimonas subvibrioides ATCC 15264]